MSKPKLDAARMQTELSQSAFFRPSNKPSSPHVNMSTSKQSDKPADQHTDITISQDVNKSTPLQVDKSTSPQAGKSIQQQVSRLTPAQMERFTTYLRPGTIKAVKLLALETDHDVYEVVQEALEAHLRKQGRG